MLIHICSTAVSERDIAVAKVLEAVPPRGRGWLAEQRATASPPTKLDEKLLMKMLAASYSCERRRERLMLFVPAMASSYLQSSRASSETTIRRPYLIM